MFSVSTVHCTGYMLFLRTGMKVHCIFLCTKYNIIAEFK